MKVIKYQLCTEVNHGTEDEPNIEQVFSAVTLGWSEGNETIAKAEAYNGEYTIEDNGEPEPEPTVNERMKKLETENKLLREQVSAQADQAEFYEDCIAEMAAIVYA